MFWSLFFGKKAPLIEVGALEARLQTGEAMVLLDVREPVETKNTPLAGALCIPLGDLVKRLGEIPRDRPVVLFCPRDRRSTMGGVILMKKGCTNVLVLKGGLVAWRALKKQTEGSSL